MALSHVVALLALLGAAAPAEAVQANPIRKIVTLLQNMQKEIEGEGAKEKELFDKFMCYCNGNNGDLQKKAADGQASIEQLSATLKSSTAEKAQTAQELLGHKGDRAQAESDLAQGTTIREKEASEFAALKADSETNIAAMASAIPALEKGMGAASLLQMPGADRLKKIIQSATNVDATDRRNVLAFLEQSGDYVPQSGQIVGILKSMKDDMEASLKEAVADEEKAVSGFADLKASKQKEIAMATEAIEVKTARVGELAVTVAQTQDAVEDATTELADTQKFIAQLAAQCSTKEKEFAERSKVRSEEIAAISDAISILNDDDALDVFKKAIPSALLQQATNFLQQKGGKASMFQKAEAILAGAANKAHSPQLNVLLFTVRSKIRLQAKSGMTSFAEVIKMVDDMIVLLGKDGDDDAKQKSYCEGEFDKAADEEAASKSKMASLMAEMSETSDIISSAMEEINSLTSSTAALDKQVAEASEQRKEEHAEYVEFLQLGEVAVGLVKKASQRLQKFYNPTLYKAPPKTEMSMEEKIIAAGTFAQVHAHKDAVALPPAPETFQGAYVQKSAKSAGVLSLMDTLISELKSDMKDAEFEEKTAQTEYAELMADCQAMRASYSKSLTDKSATKAQMEAKLMTIKKGVADTKEDLSLISSVIGDLHASCDFILQNFDLRKEARTNEIESLKNAKAVLSGASYSL